jgi:hypothetical protein
MALSKAACCLVALCLWLCLNRGNAKHNRAERLRSDQQSSAQCSVPHKLVVCKASDLGTVHVQIMGEVGCSQWI